ncbi:MAG TPA: hypothetical protein VMM80_01770 [Bacteroidota bacterium]|nr:hypothetical protein [Bacteroidota bacterium]
MRGRWVAIAALLPALWAGCNEELGPVDTPSGFSGTIRFRHWPSADSLHDMRIVAFVSFPTDSAGILPTLLAGGGAVYPAIGTKFPTMVDSLPYLFTTASGTNLQVGTYAYVIVAQQYGPNVLADWRPVGVYAAAPGTFLPAALRVVLHHVQEGVDMDVDFSNLPPKPWR